MTGHKPAEEALKTYQHYIGGQYVDQTKSVWISMAEGSPANPFVMR